MNKALAAIWFKDGEWRITDSKGVIHSCHSKGGALEKLAELMDATSPPSPTLNGMGTVEVTVLVTLQVDMDDEEATLPILDMRASVWEAIHHAVSYGEGEGFVHTQADVISIGMSGVDVLCVE